MEIHHPAEFSYGHNLTHLIRVTKALRDVWILEPGLLELNSAGWTELFDLGLWSCSVTNFYWAWLTNIGYVWRISDLFSKVYVGSDMDAVNQTTAGPFLWQRGFVYLCVTSVCGWWLGLSRVDHSQHEAHHEIRSKQDLSLLSVSKTTTLSAGGWGFWHASHWFLSMIQTLDTWFILFTFQG